MSFRERLQSWRYNLVPDHLVGEILTKRWTDNAIPFLALVVDDRRSSARSFPASSS